MERDTELSKCPSCGTRIGLWQASFAGKHKPFTCRGCGQRIEKTKVHPALALGAVFSFGLAKLRTDDVLFLTGFFIVLALGLIIVSLHRTPIAMVQDD